MPDKLSRIENDNYPSPTKLIKAWLWGFSGPYLDKNASYLEPCNGDGAISNSMKELGYHNWETTDIRDGEEYDATSPDYWQNREPDWVITNPPFNKATPILDAALCRAKIGVIALVRASYLEPCKDRRHILEAGISSISLVNPRPKFRADSKGTDSTTVAIICWHKKQIMTDYVELSYLVDWHL